ncbi:MAG: DUF484 family protein [Marinibacterium sp.]|nr:DUF484 family protein [Marinibacterium sp.]
MSTNSPTLAEDLRSAILRAPDIVLDDSDVMRALIAADDKARGDNVVDLRGIAMDRLSSRLDQLEDTHRSVIAAAYDNLSGMQLIHRAALRLMDPTDFESFLHNLDGDVAAILRVDAVRLVLETRQDDTSPTLAQFSEILKVADCGFTNAYLGVDEAALPNSVTLRQIDGGSSEIYGSVGPALRSEACLRLDLGAGCLPALLLLGSGEPQQFNPQQATDLLEFFTGIAERSLRHWLS